MIGFPIDSHVTFDADGTPEYDRAVTSAPLRQLIKSLFSDGVLPNPSTNLQVASGTGMTVVVNPGFANCNGCLKLEETKRTLAVQASNTTYDRIDTVVVRLNDNDSERICDLYIKEGVPATSPVRPSLTRSASIWELGLADLFITKNSTAVSNQRITDTRYETARCGVISSIGEFDTTTLYQQIQADLKEFQDVSEAEFNAWYESIKGELSEDAAGNLQNQIGMLEQLQTAAKEDLVSAINEVRNSTASFSADISNAISIAQSAKTDAAAAKTTASGAKTTADSALSKANTATTKANQASQAVADANETADRAVSYAATAMDEVDALNKYITFIPDMQNLPTILQWAKQCNGLMIGMMITPYAPADGPQTAVSGVVEWTILVLGQPGSKTRQEVIAFGFGSGVYATMKRSIFNGNWLGGWVTVR